MTRTLRVTWLHVLLVALIMLVPVTQLPRADAQTPVFVGRIAGSDRIGTAIELSQRAWGSPPVDAVLIARADAFPDALAAGPLARQLNAPILLTSSTQLLPVVANEVRRLAPETIYLLGGEAALSTGVENALRALAPSVQRLAGANRYATAEAIAERTEGNVAVVASGENFPDALSASSLAPSEILLTQRHRVSFDQSRHGQLTIVGGTAAIAKDLLVAPRLAGANRYLTNLAIVREVFSRRDGNLQLFVATGENFPDALTAGALTQPILLVNPAWTELPAELEEFLTDNRHRITAMFVFGGTSAVPEATERLVAAALGVPAPGTEPTPTETPDPGEPTEEPTEEPTVPAAPTNLASEALSSATVRLTWSDNADDETGFEVERSLGVGGTFSKVADLNADVVEFTDDGLAAETQHCYRVRARNPVGVSAFSAVTCASTPAPPNLPAAPSRLEVLATGPERINVNWRDNANNETGFEIFRGRAPEGPFVPHALSGVDDSTTLDRNGVQRGVQYCYRVRAVNDDGPSAFTDAACDTTPLEQTQAEAPSELRITSSSATAIELRWNDNSLNELGFEIERRLALEPDSDFSLAGKVGIGRRMFSDTGLRPATQYCYRLRATNELVDLPSDFSNTACATTGVGDAAPVRPANLTATAETSTAVTLSWDPVDGAEVYEVERRVGPDEDFEPLDTVDGSVSELLDDGLLGGTEYCYQIRARNDDGPSALSDPVCVTTPASPAGFEGSRLSVWWFPDP